MSKNPPRTRSTPGSRSHPSTSQPSTTRKGDAEKVLRIFEAWKRVIDARKTLEMAAGYGRGTNEDRLRCQEVLAQFDRRLAALSGKVGLRRLAALSDPLFDLVLMTKLLAIEEVLRVVKDAAVPDKSHVDAINTLLTTSKDADRLARLIADAGLDHPKVVEVLLSDAVQTSLYTEGKRDAAVVAVAALAGVGARTVWARQAKLNKAVTRLAAGGGELNVLKFIAAAAELGLGAVGQPRRPGKKRP